MRGLVFAALALAGAATAQSIAPINAHMAPPAVGKPSVQYEARKARPLPPAASVPECHCREQCDAMWAQAPDAIEKASGMRLRIATDSLLDTDAPSGFEGLHGRVVKTPNGKGGYRFVASFDPSHNTPAEDADLKLAKTQFNMAVNTSANELSCP